MSNGYAVGRGLSRIADRLQRGTEQKSAHITRMGGLGLAGQRLGMQEEQLGMTREIFDLDKTLKQLQINKVQEEEEHRLALGERAGELSELNDPGGWEGFVGADSPDVAPGHNLEILAKGIPKEKHVLDDKGKVVGFKEITRGEEYGYYRMYYENLKPPDIARQSNMLLNMDRMLREGGATEDGTDEASAQLRSIQPQLKLAAGLTKALAEDPGKALFVRLVTLGEKGMKPENVKRAKAWWEKQTAAKAEKLYETTAGWQPAAEAVGKKKPEIAATDKGTLARKIANLKEAYPGLDDQNIRRLAAGTIKVIKDPVTDEWIITDLGTRERLPLETRTKTTEPPRKTEAPETALYDMADLVSGPISAGLAAGSIPSGWVGLPIAERTVQARQYIQSAQNELIRSLSINPKFPVGEINRLREEINISPRFFDNPDMLKQRMRAIDKYLRWRLDKELIASENTKLPKTVRQNALSAANDIESFLGLLGVPQATHTATPEDRELINKWLPKPK